MKQLVLGITLLIFYGLAAEELIPRARYEAIFEAKATGKIYPQDWQLLGVEAPYPKVALVFRNSSKKIIRPWRSSNVLWINSANYIPCRMEFYLPDNVSSVKLYPSKAKIRNFQLRKIDDRENWSIPLNPLASGTWKGCQVTIGEKNTIFDAEKSWIYSDPMPVASGECYRVVVDGEPGTEKSGLIRLQFYTDVSGIKSYVSGNKEPIRLRKRQKLEYEFVVPPKAKWLRIAMTWGTYYSYNVVKIK